MTLNTTPANYLPAGAPFKIPNGFQNIHPGQVLLFQGNGKFTAQICHLVECRIHSACNMKSCIDPGCLSPTQIYGKALITKDLEKKWENTKEPI